MSCTSGACPEYPGNVEWRAKHYEAAMRALERAAKCARYDDHTLALARRLVRARERYSAPSFFDKLAIVEDTRSADSNKLKALGQLWSAHARRLRNKGDVARALRWVGALVVVGDLMQRDPGAWQTAKAGGAWQQMAYKTVPPSKKGKVIASNDSTDFAVYARANGRADLADLTPRLAAHSRQVAALSGQPNGRYGEMLWLRAGDLDKWMNLLEGLPIVLVMNLIYLGLWWLVVGAFLWRARAAPSSRRERVELGLATMLTLALTGGLGLWVAISSDGGTLSSLENLMASLAIFGFFGTPFVLALLCACLTLRRHQARFALAPRIDMELALAPWARAFLRWLLPVCALGSIAFLLASWALWLLASWRKWGLVDLAKLLPPDRNGKTLSLLWDSTDPSLMVYGGGLCCLSLLIWFGRWRWTAPADLRPLTQGALRWWKESVGVAAVTVSWIFLVLALISLPLFVRAEAQLQRALQVGELEVRNR